ncbi:MAG TPA: catalase [Bryobacteraceae bacterium]|jgi:catalase|nr:catalase [Bryobacteraceae bacterium]
MTTGAGAPVGDNQNSLTVGPRGPVLMQDLLLIKKMAHFNRERIPEHVVHAKGSGAHGVFEVTEDITNWTKAKLFESGGKKTELFVRLSTVGGEKGSGDTEQQRLIHNIVMSMKGVSREIQARQIRHFLKADMRYGRGIMDGLCCDPKLVQDVEEHEGVLR